MNRQEKQLIEKALVAESIDKALPDLTHEEREAMISQLQNLNHDKMRNMLMKVAKRQKERIEYKKAFPYFQDSIIDMLVKEEFLPMIQKQRNKDYMKKHREKRLQESQSGDTIKK